MRNIKEDLLLSIKGESPISCARIVVLFPVYSEHYAGVVSHNEEVTVYLKMARTDQEYENFLSALDKRGYLGDDSVVWLADGSWMEVSTDEEGDFWYHCKFPEIPNELCNV